MSKFADRLRRKTAVAVDRLRRGTAAAVGFVGQPVTDLITVGVGTVVITAVGIGYIVNKLYSETKETYKKFGLMAAIAVGILGTAVGIPLGIGVIAAVVAILAPLAALAAICLSPLLGMSKGWNEGFRSVLKQIFSFRVPEIIDFFKQVKVSMAAAAAANVVNQPQGSSAGVSEQPNTTAISYSSAATVTPVDAAAVSSSSRSLTMFSAAPNTNSTQSVPVEVTSTDDDALRARMPS